MSTVCPIRNVLDQATLLPVISEMLLIHWSAAFGGNLTLVLDQSIIVLLVGRLCGYFVDHVAVYGSSGTFTRSFLSACRCTRGSMCFSLRLFCDSSASDLWHSHVPLPAVGYALFLPAVGFALFLPAVGFALFLPAVGFALFFFSPASSKLSILPKLCWLQLELCSLHGVAASLRLRTLFTAPPHALPRAARGLVVSCTTHSPPPRAARVEDVFPELVCSGSSLFSKQLLDSSCVHLT